MPFLELFDETLDINSTENYDLSLQVSNDGLSFSILDTLRNKFVMLRSYESEDGSSYDISNLEDLLSMDDFLIRRFRKIRIITPTDRSTLVPAPLYDETRRESYFRYNHPPENNRIFLVNEITEPEAFLIFTIPDELNALLKKFFPGIRLYHQLKPLLGYYSSGHRIAGGNTVSIHLEKKFLSMTLFDQNSLRFCNTFTYESASDVRYYILYVLKRLNIGSDELIFLSGAIGKNDEIGYSLSDYLRNIRYAQPEGNFTLSYVFSETRVHKFLNLFIVSS